jgi:hypothetical protein
VTRLRALRARLYWRFVYWAHLQGYARDEDLR